MIPIDDLILQISRQFKQLNKCDQPAVKEFLLNDLERLCHDAIHRIDQQNQSFDQLRKRNQIKNVLERCRTELKTVFGNERVISAEEQQRESIEETRMRLSRAVVTNMLFRQLRESETVIPPEELNELQRRFYADLELIKDINEMVKGQGDNLEAVETELIKSEQNVKVANEQLKDAKSLQHKTRMMKIRLGISSFFGVLGGKLFGIPGMIAGLMTGLKFW